MAHVTVYYNICQKCGRKFNQRLSQSSEVRVGKEVFTCKCGEQYTTGLMEWTHLTPKRRFDYFVSSGEIGLLLICTLAPALFAFFISGHKVDTTLRVTSWGLLVAAIGIGISWSIKMLVVKRSLKRVPHEDPFAARGGWPWNW